MIFRQEACELGPSAWQSGWRVGTVKVSSTRLEFAGAAVKGRLHLQLADLATASADLNALVREVELVAEGCGKARRFVQRG